MKQRRIRFLKQKNCVCWHRYQSTASCERREEDQEKTLVSFFESFVEHCLTYWENDAMQFLLKNDQYGVKKCIVNVTCKFFFASGRTCEEANLQFWSLWLGKPWMSKLWLSSVLLARIESSLSYSCISSWNLSMILSK